jgi:hypothetical protein
VEAAGAPGLDRHEALVAAFIAASQLFQGVADAEMAAAGQDDLTPAQQAGMTLLLTWRGRSDRPGGARARSRRPSSGRAAALARASPSRGDRGKIAEGYAHYAIYPEAYLEAAAGCRWTSRRACWACAASARAWRPWSRSGRARGCSP